MSRIWTGSREHLLKRMGGVTICHVSVLAHPLKKTGEFLLNNRLT
jgi:hypothetical protein